jgi:TldD protein
MKDRVHSAIRASAADFTDIRLERSWVSTIARRGVRHEGASTGVDQGGCVRVLNHGHGWGLASFTDLEDLSAAVERAQAMSRSIALPDPIPWVEALAHEDDVQADLDGDVREVPLEDKYALVARLGEDLLGTDRRIGASKVAYRDEVTEYCYGNSEGTLITQLRPEFTLSVAVWAREGGTEERALASVGRRRGWDTVQGVPEALLEAARTAVELLGASRVREGRYPVVLDPKMAGVLIHETIGHMCEADTEDGDETRLLPLGHHLGRECLTVVDDGHATGLRGSLPYDDEGTPTRRTVLVQHGVVVGHLHTRETASRMGEAPTGNGRALSYRHEPIVRMTNTGLVQGSGTLQDLLEGIDEGVYAMDAVAGRRHGEDCSYTAGYGRMIRNGQLAEVVKGVTVSGNVFELLGSIDAVAEDFAWNESGGGCRKAGQGPLSVAEGAPHVRLASAAVGVPRL